MVAVKPSETEGFVRRPPKGIEVILVFGPDAGLVDERCRTLLAAAVPDLNDPFQLVRIGGDQLASSPERLIEEAGSIALFGTRKAIWVNGLDKPIDRSVKLLLQGPTSENLVVIQAGDLAKQSALRSLCEQSPRAAALACYAGGPRENAQLVDDILREAGLAIEAGAKRDLIGALGEDRRQSRAEIDKLVLYKAGEKTITSEDIATIIVDANAVAINGVIDAAFGGDYAALDQELSRAFAERLGADPLLGAALRHAFALSEARSSIDSGAPLAQAARDMRLFWRREGLVTRQLGIWNASALDGALADLNAAIRRIRRSALSAESVARMAFWRIARHARPHSAGR
ncbi:DNA polymerase III, delta subunit [Rhizobiales bacterium GAS191]|jgi:DNA polymerase-3 subunit delta|nr:DNA polymerase III, delta subunit [Rhizobiales bacterium GAS191]